jgi:hypothetical protein
MQTQPSEFENCDFQIEEETTRTHPPLLHAHLLRFPNKAPYWFFFPDPKLEKQTENRDTAFDAKRTEREDSDDDGGYDQQRKQNKTNAVTAKAERRRCENDAAWRGGRRPRGLVCPSHGTTVMTAQFGLY